MGNRKLKSSELMSDFWIDLFLFLVICREIIDNTGKENGIDIVMPERTYHLIAESAEDARWVHNKNKDRSSKPDFDSVRRSPKLLH